MPKFTPKRYEQIFSRMIARVVSRTDLSDVADTSVVKHILGAAARSDDELYYQMGLLLQLFSIDSAQGDDLDDRAKDLPNSTVSRNLATRAVGTVVCSRAGTSGTVTIPAGTKIQTREGITVVTTAPGAITPLSAAVIPDHAQGRDSGPIPAIAEVAGLAGNVAPNTLVKFGSKPAGVDSVTNLVAFTGGQDKETDDAFRARIKNYIAGLARCPEPAMEANLIGKEDPETGKVIRFARVSADPVSRGLLHVYVDDGAGTGEAFAEAADEVLTGDPGARYLKLAHYPVRMGSPPTFVSSTRGPLALDTDCTLNPANGQVYLRSAALVAGESISASYTYYTGLVAYAQKVVDGVKTDRKNFPGLRAGGILARCLPPQVLIQTIELAVTAEDGYDAATVRKEVQAEVLRYINGLGIGENVIRNEIISRAMDVPGVYNLALTTPATDIVILDDQLPKTTTANVTVR